MGATLAEYFEPDDAPTLTLLALLKSFTYTRDHDHREFMLSAIERAMLPTLGVANAALTNAVKGTYRELTKEGGTA